MKLLILALCVVAAASKKAGKRTSNLIFTHESGAQTRIGFDGTKLTVPGYCEQDTCTAAASERASHTSQLSGLEARVTGLNTAISQLEQKHVDHSQDNSDAHAGLGGKIAANKDRIQALSDALSKEDAARRAEDATLRAALLSEDAARKSEDRALKALILSGDALVNDLIVRENGARKAHAAAMQAQVRWYYEKHEW